MLDPEYPCMFPCYQNAGPNIEKGVSLQYITLSWAFMLAQCSTSFKHDNICIKMTINQPMDNILMFHRNNCTYSAARNNKRMINNQHNLRPRLTPCTIIVYCFWNTTHHHNLPSLHHVLHDSPDRHPRRHLPRRPNHPISCSSRLKRHSDLPAMVNRRRCHAQLRMSRLPAGGGRRICPVQGQTCTFGEDAKSTFAVPKRDGGKVEFP